MKTTVSTIFISFMFLFLSEPEASSDPVNEGLINGTNAVHIVPLVTYPYKGSQWQYYATNARLSKTPRWKTDQAEPPLSVSKALSVAEKYGHIVNPTCVAFVPLKVVLKRWFEGIWFYDVQLEPSNPDDSGGWMQPIEVAVLMDGTVADREEVVSDPSSQRYMPVNK